MAPVIAAEPARNLAEMLLHKGKIDRQQYQTAVEEYRQQARPLSRILVDHGAISEDEEYRVLSESGGFPVFRPQQVPPSAEAQLLVPRSICLRDHLVPVQLDGRRLMVAMEDPTDLRAINAVEALTEKTVVPVLGRAEDIRAAIRALPDDGAEADAAHSRGNPLVFLLLMAIWGAPVGAFYYTLLNNKAFREGYEALATDTFERILFFVLAWSAWAIIAYWITDIVVGLARRGKRA